MTRRLRPGGVRQHDLLVHPALAGEEDLPSQHDGAAEPGHHREDVQPSGDEGEAGLQERRVRGWEWC